MSRGLVPVQGKDTKKKKLISEILQLISILKILLLRL